MLRHAKRLQSTFDEFYEHYGQDQFALSAEEWRQIEYLLWITQPFLRFTSLLSQTKDVTIHLVFSIYNKLFDHLEKPIRQLQRKKVPVTVTVNYRLSVCIDCLFVLIVCLYY